MSDWTAPGLQPWQIGYEDPEDAPGPVLVDEPLVKPEDDWESDSPTWLTPRWLGKEIGDAWKSAAKEGVQPELSHARKKPPVRYYRQDGSYGYFDD